MCGADNGFAVLGFGGFDGDDGGALLGRRGLHLGGGLDNGCAEQGVRNEQSIAGLFDEEKYESGTNSVSWAGESVEYFIAEKAR